METVKIKQPIVEGNDTGYCVINEVDFDKSKHELFKDDAASKEMTYPEVKAALTAKGVAFAPNISKADALKLLEEQE